MKPLFLLLLLPLRLLAQGFAGTPGPIPDNNTATAFPATVSGLPASLGAGFGLQSVVLTINHPYVGDLLVQLQAPDGTTLTLSNRNGGNGRNYTNTAFAANANTSIVDGSAPFSATFRPQGILGAVNNGQNPNGTWRLLVRDASAGDVGSVAAWRLTFSPAPAPPFVFTSSNLPIVRIETYGLLIPDAPKITAHMAITANGPGQRNRLLDPANDYRNNIGIELRGSSSQGFPQKQYSIETRDLANVQHDTAVLGMPTENAWVLYAPYDDKTCLRNVLSYDIANKTGHYAARTRYCEVLLNGEYQGIYVLMEQIKRDANRVNIKKTDPVDTAGNKLTGGYIFKIDKPTGTGGSAGWNSRFRTSGGATLRFLYDYPKPADLVPKQAAYLQAYVDSAETALASAAFANPATGYAKYLDVPSFIDYFLLNEASRNVDGLRLSTYLHKKRRSDGGKIVAGPAWDYNLAWWNANYCAGDQATGWAYNFNQVCPNDPSQVPFWWARLLQDPAFAAALQCRYRALRRTTLHADTLARFIDATAARLTEAQARHFTAWPILGQYTWPNPAPIPATYPAEIAALKSWLLRRFAWLDANMPGVCRPAAVLAAAAGPVVTVSPNPFQQGLRLRATLPARAPVQAALYDLTGRRVAGMEYGTRAAGPQELALETAETLPAGVYVLRTTVGGVTTNVRVVKE